MKKPLLTLAASTLSIAFSALAGRYAPVTVDTNAGPTQWSVTPSNLWRSNAPAMIDALTNAGFNGGAGSGGGPGTNTFSTNSGTSLLSSNVVAGLSITNPTISGIATGNITGNASGNAGAATNLLGSISGATQISGVIPSANLPVPNFSTNAQNAGTATNILGGGTGNTLTNSTNFVSVTFTNHPWQHIQTNWGWIDASNGVAMAYLSNGVFYVAVSIQSYSAYIAANLNVGSVNGGGGNYYGKYNFNGDNQGDSLLTFSQYAGGNTALLDQNLNFTLNGGTMSATHYIGSTSGYAGYVTNAAYTDAVSQPIYYVGNPSDFGEIVAISNVWNGWNTISVASGEQTSILFTNYYSQPFAMVPTCFICDANGHFSADTSFSDGLGACGLVYLANISTTTYGVFGFDSTQSPQMGHAPWMFSILTVGGQ